ncbi:uncharacterized protein LOC105728299 isoform X3 [Aotus nancymaae]|uniref:uncharacterized protein LOC105728299 isoform X3 n=1 Tax=Aotus nancymaae TaxID=37293 RepID=UPI0030FE7B46
MELRLDPLAVRRPEDQRKLNRVLPCPRWFQTPELKQSTHIGLPRMRHSKAFTRWRPLTFPGPTPVSQINSAYKSPSLCGYSNTDGRRWTLSELNSLLDAALSAWILVCRPG